MALTWQSAGFNAENLSNYTVQAHQEGILPLPIGMSHKFAPIALGVSRSWNSLRRFSLLILV
jgi:hypothetical protein